MKDEFKVGDKVRYREGHIFDMVVNGHGDYPPGHVFAISSVRPDSVDFEGSEYCSMKHCLEFAPESSSAAPQVVNSAQKNSKCPTVQTHTKTMWGLAVKSTPNSIDDELFTTRAKARRCKFANDLDYLKVVKVTLTWEG